MSTRCASLVVRPPEFLTVFHRRSIFHPAFVNLALRNLIFEPRVTVPDDPNDVDSVWRAAVLDETAKRSALPRRLGVPCS